jgi:hypothetical protein
LNRTPVAQEIRAIIDKQDNIKLKSFLKWKKQWSELWDSIQNGRKIFASYSSDKWLISRIYKKLRKLNTKIINNKINKWKNELNSFQKKKYKWPIITWKNIQHP